MNIITDKAMPIILIIAIIMFILGTYLIIKDEKYLRENCTLVLEFSDGKKAYHCGEPK